MHEGEGKLCQNVDKHVSCEGVLLKWVSHILNYFKLDERKCSEMLKAIKP